MDHKDYIEQTILPYKFQLLPSLTNQHGYGLVYGRLVQKNITFRIITWIKQGSTGFYNQNKFLHLEFAKKSLTGVIEKVGSERLVHTADLHPTHWQAELNKAIHQWRHQISETDGPCNKCDNGRYRYVPKNGTKEVEVVCNRCGGKGYQNFNDRRRNFGFDRYAQGLAERIDEQDGLMTGQNIMPNWVPTPDNLIQMPSVEQLGTRSPMPDEPIGPAKKRTRKK